jgi:hypothetical protein
MKEAMMKHRSMIALVTLLAVAVSPAIAAAAPCCCAQKPVEAVKSCCRKADDSARASAAALQPCCAKREPVRSSVAPRTCCCVESIPALPVSRDDATAKQTVRGATFAVAPASIAAVVPSFATHRAEAVVGPPPLCGPPLLALLCTWLK